MLYHLVGMSSGCSMTLSSLEIDMNMGKQWGIYNICVY